MKSYMIGYDLNKPRQNYTDLIDAIKQLGAWWHYLDSTWIVKTDLSAVEIRDRLRPFMDGNDELLVAQHGGDSAWVGFNKDGSDWLLANL